MKHKLVLRLGIATLLLCIFAICRAAVQAPRSGNLTLPPIYAPQPMLNRPKPPKDQWQISGYITVGNDAANFKVRLEGYPARYLSYTVQKQNIKLSILDARDKPVPNAQWLTLAPNVPDVIKPVAEKMGQSSCYLDLILDRKNAKPGYYTLKLTAAVDATDSETKESVKLRDAVATTRVYLTPQPDQEPALRPGQRFLGTPWQQVGGSTETGYREVKSGKQITWREVATKIATLQTIEPAQKGSRLTFALEGHAGPVYIETDAPATGLPYLTPVLTDPVVRALKSKYEGKRVWRYGGPAAQCMTADPGLNISLSGRLDLPMRIRRIERTYMPLAEMAIGNATFIGGERASAFVTDNPLVVILDAPAKGLKLSALSYEGRGTSGLPSINEIPDASEQCLGLWTEVSDRWDFEREYSLSSPFSSHLKWSPKMRKAALNGEIMKGMTREMVAWVMGWPSIYGTKSDILTLNDWSYDNIPSEGHVYFKNGKMVGQDWPRLP